MREGDQFEAKETEYAGVRFRSRLEARWAVFFDAIGIKWEYEKYIYNLNLFKYVPDFWLPGLGVFVEIKGRDPSDIEFEKASRLAKASNFITFVFVGAPGEEHMYVFEPERMVMYRNTFTSRQYNLWIEFWAWLGDEVSKTYRCKKLKKKEKRCTHSRCWPFYTFDMHTVKASCYGGRSCGWRYCGSRCLWLGPVSVYRCTLEEARTSLIDDYNRYTFLYSGWASTSDETASVRHKAIEMLCYCLNSGAKALQMPSEIDDIIVWSLGPKATVPIDTNLNDVFRVTNNIPVTTAGPNLVIGIVNGGSLDLYWALAYCKKKSDFSEYDEDPDFGYPFDDRLRSARNSARSYFKGLK